MYKFLFMAENKKSFVMYVDNKEQFEALTDSDAGQLIKHIFKYVNDENPITNNTIVNISFIPIKLQLKRDLSKWDITKEQKKVSGQLGNLKRWHTDLYDLHIDNKLTLEKALIIAESRKVSHTDKVPSQTIANVAVNDNDNVNVNDILSFSDFWNAYDKKADKVKCENRYKKLSHSDILKIKEVLPFYLKSTPDRQFRKNPLTWLNGKCWNDEIAIENKVIGRTNQRGLTAADYERMEKEELLNNKSGTNQRGTVYDD